VTWELRLAVRRPSAHRIDLGCDVNGKSDSCKVSMNSSRINGLRAPAGGAAVSPSWRPGRRALSLRGGGRRACGSGSAEKRERFLQDCHGEAAGRAIPRAQYALSCEAEVARDTTGAARGVLRHEAWLLNDRKERNAALVSFQGAHPIHGESRCSGGADVCLGVFACYDMRLGCCRGALPAEKKPSLCALDLRSVSPASDGTARRIFHGTSSRPRERAVATN